MQSSSMRGERRETTAGVKLFTLSQACILISHTLIHLCISKNSFPSS